MEEKKQLIINADDFGISNSANQAVFAAFKNGVLTSTSIMANAPAFENAINLIPELKGISIGVHLNIIEFATLKENPKEKSLLYDKNGNYNNNYLALIQKSYNKDFLNEVEEDFRLQIETVLDRTTVDHIDSHVHVHAIPEIFKIVCKLAREYGIKNIRTQFEYPYFVPDVKKYLSVKYPLNLIKIALLNTFTLTNKKYLYDNFNEINTNENFIGVNYTGYMDKNTLLYALKNVKQRTEAILHPSFDTNDSLHYTEYQALINEEFKLAVKQAGIELINFSNEKKSIV